MYTTIPPQLEPILTWEDLYEEIDYNREYDNVHEDIILQNSEFLEYEENYIKELVIQKNKKEREL